MVDFGFGSVNWIAVVAAGVVAWVIGAVWFAPPVFGNRWMAALGKKPEELGSPGPALAGGLILGIITALFLALVLGFVRRAGAMENSAFDGAVVGLVVWVGFVLLTSAPSLLFEKRSTAVFGITQSYNAVSFLVMGIILAVWV